MKLHWKVRRMHHGTPETKAAFASRHDAVDMLQRRQCDQTFIQYTGPNSGVVNCMLNEMRLGRLRVVRSRLREDEEILDLG